MSTKVVNVRVKYIRPAYRDLREWMADPQNVYIGRKGVIILNGARFPKNDSVFANPFRVKNSTREIALGLYREYMEKCLKDSPDLRAQLSALKGKTLGCWCAPEKCHGNVLIELIALYST